jgi:predicted transcriptional regulator
MADKEQREAPTPIRFPDDLKAKIKKKAEKEDRSFSYIVIKILNEYFTKKK